MATITYNSADSHKRISDAGMEMLTNTFDDVPMEYRAEVFVEYLRLLDEAGFPYDKAQFGATE